MVKLTDLVHRIVDRAYEELFALITNTLPGQDFVDRREEIVNYVDGARHALLQVLVLLEWVWRHKDAICTATEGKVFIGMQVHHVRVALDRLFYTHRDLFRKQVATRPYAFAAAIDILAAGSSVARVSRAIDLSQSKTWLGDRHFLRELNLAIQSSLIVRERVPPQCTCARVENGTLRVMDADNFVLRLTLEHPSPFARWRLVDFQLQLPFKGGYGSCGNAFEVLKPEQRHIQELLAHLAHLLEGNVQPICDTYNLCQSFCNALKLEVLILQAKELAKGYWTGHLEVDISRAGVLNILFWKGLDLRLNQEEKEMRLPTANSKEVEENGFRMGNTMSSCCIRVWLAGEDKMRPLRARCSYQLASKGPVEQSTEELFSLLIYQACVSVPSLLRNALEILVGYRLQVVYDILKQETTVKSLLQRGLLIIAMHGNSLYLYFYGSYLAFGVDRKSGHIIITASCSSRCGGSEELEGLLHEWHTSIQDVINPTSIESFIGVFQRVLRHLFLNYLTLLASGSYDLVCDRRCFELQVFESDKKGGSISRDKSSIYFLLDSRSALASGELAPDVTSVGESWCYLELESCGTDLRMIAPHAYLVMASASRKMAPLPYIKNRYLLDDFLAEEKSHEVWLSQVVTAATKVMQTCLKLDGAATALDFACPTETSLKNFLSNEKLNLDLGKTHSTRSIEEGKLQSLSVWCNGDDDWIWNIVLPALKVPRFSFDDKFMFKHKNEGWWLEYRNHDSAHIIRLGFRGVWDPLLLGMKLNDVVKAVAGLLSMAALLQRAHPHFVPSDSGEVIPLPLPKLIFWHSGGLACALCHSVFEHPLESVVKHQSPHQGGRFYLTFTDSVMHRVDGAWRLIEEDFCRCRDLNKLLERVEALAYPLRTLARTLSIWPKLDFVILPWSLNSVAVTCQAASSRLLLLTVDKPLSYSGGSGVVRLTYGETNALDAEPSRDWAKHEFDGNAVQEALKACFGLSAV